MPEVPRPPRPVLLAAPDAFKGTATAVDLAAAAARAAAGVGWDSDPCPLSDGGEGFAAVLAARGGGAWHEAVVTGPLGAPVTARWWASGDRAVVESASASGLPLAGGADGNDPVGATTRGTGELIAAAVAAGARRVLVGVGGSATTDGGRGAVEAIEGAGGLRGATVVVACDVVTPFVDAAAVFGPQKGATPDQVEVLTRRLAAYAEELRRTRGVDVGTLAGSGAAGGLAGGLAALGARLVPGFGVVAEAVDLARRVARADLVLTGEGRLDATSWEGKVVGGVVAEAGRAGVPVVIVAGSVGPGGVGGGGPGPEVVDLSARFGPAASMADPARCLATALSEGLVARTGPHPGVAGV
ncbi:MAG TPA: glycerate kinase, partial [Acidimicrobiales bacterium]|nr:glycerate kinase [Acidimicrobiales bacterium]